MNKKVMVFIVVLLIPMLNACVRSGYNNNALYPVQDIDLIEVSHKSVKTLLEQSSKKIPKGSLIVVSTLVNVDNLKQTSAFGRIVSNQIGSAFNNAGYRIRGMELPTNSFVVSEGGFLHLTDETKKSLRDKNVSALLAGVFAAGKKSAYVSLRLVDISSTDIISSTDFVVPMGPDTKALLKSRKTGDSLSSVYRHELD
jgi:curli biogenesis system outer membrane secretion channel CsgG